MAKTKIEWADAVWNPVTGCTKVSQGCKNCYAERLAKRLAGRCGYPEAPHQFDVTLHPDRLEEPLHWRKPRRVFVNSMSDLFHPDVPYAFIRSVFEVMRICSHHTFLVLTKRPERMAELMLKEYFSGYWPAKNIWLVASVEDQQTADERIPWLLKTPAAVRGLSCEPLLGPLNIQRHLLDGWPKFAPQLHWVICGGESGPNARPMHPDWARWLRDQCQVAGTPFFFKQWGEWLFENQLMGSGLTSIPVVPKINTVGGWTYYWVGKKLAGRRLDGREWNEYPTFSPRPAPTSIV